MSPAKAHPETLRLPTRPEESPARALVHTTLELIGHAEYSYPKKVRAAVLAAMNASRASVAGLARLNFSPWRAVFRCRSGYGAAVPREGWISSLPRANPLSPRRAGAFSRPQNRSHVADRRSCDHRGQSRRACGFRFPPRRHGGRRQGRAPGSVSRLHAFPRIRNVGRIVQNIGGTSQISPQSPRARLRANW